MDRRRADRATGCLAAALGGPGCQRVGHGSYIRLPPPRLLPGGARGWTGTQATRQWHGTGAPGDEDSDVESLAHNIQIGAPRCQIRQGSPKRQIGGSARVYLAFYRLISVPSIAGIHGTRTGVGPHTYPSHAVPRNARSCRREGVVTGWDCSRRCRQRLGAQWAKGDSSP
jgi:hypothetical protein